MYINHWKPEISSVNIVYYNTFKKKALKQHCAQESDPELTEICWSVSIHLSEFCALSFFKPRQQFKNNFAALSQLFICV